MTNAQIKKLISQKSEALHGMVQLSPEWEALAVEIRTLRASLGNPFASIASGVYFSGKGKKREAFYVE
jgi:hypothetical protein